MSLTGTILWADNRPLDHNNHLHVEPPPPRMTGVPPLRNPGMTEGVELIYAALTLEFGLGVYFTDPRAPSAGWTHMGGYNRRQIAGSKQWSQHAWWNALDIGPYYGVTEQQKYYDFLTSEVVLPDMTPEESTQLAQVHSILTKPLLNNPDPLGLTAPQAWSRTYHLILGQIDSDLTDADLAKIAKAVNDEQRRRLES